MILVIWASPNSDGLTAAAKDRVCEGIRAAGAGAEELHLNEYEIKGCLACGDGWGLCRSEGRCAIKDDFASAYSKLLLAEGLVFVTPVYWHDMAECLKACLDRLRRCETAHNHALAGKRCLIAACAGGSGRGTSHCLYDMELTLGHMGMECADRLPVTRFSRDYMLPALSAAARAFAASLIPAETKDNI